MLLLSRDVYFLFTLGGPGRFRGGRGGRGGFRGRGRGAYYGSYY